MAHSVTQKPLYNRNGPNARCINRNTDGRGKDHGAKRQFQRSGKQGEELAVAYLREKGYTILDTNFRAGRNEIDIVAREGDMLVIVEVKSRRSNYFAEPEYSVTKDKQKALIRAANSSWSSP